MRAVFKLANPDELVAEITLRATVGDFRLLEQIFKEKEAGGKWPLSELRAALSEVIAHSTAHFQSDVEHGRR